MNGKTKAGTEDTTVRGSIARWLRPAGLTPSDADALRGCFSAADAHPARFPAGLTPAEAEAVSRGLYPARTGAPRAPCALPAAGDGDKPDSTDRDRRAHAVHYGADKRPPQ